MAAGAMGRLRGATKCEPLVTAPGPKGVLVRSWSLRLGSTVQMQRQEFDKRPPDVLSVFLRHMRWLMVRRKPTAMPVLGQGHSPVCRYTPPPPHTGHKATRMG